MLTKLRAIGSTNNFVGIASQGVRIDGRLLTAQESKVVVNLALSKLDPERSKDIERKFFRAASRDESIPQDVKIILRNAIKEAMVELYPKAKKG